MFCCPLFFEGYLNPLVRINKMVNKHTVDYHLSPSELTSRIHSLMFLWTPNECICPSILSIVIFFSDLYDPPWLQKSFNFMVLRLLEKTFVSRKIESAHFYPCLQRKLSPPPPRFLSVFWASISPQQKGG